MATQYTTILKLALPVQGELSGTWGDVVNDNITEMVEEAVAGRKVINTWTGNSHTLTTADGTTSESRAAILTLTDTGTALTGAGTVICPANSKVYIVENGAGQAITVKTSSGTGVAVPDGTNMVVFCDGTNVEQGITNINNLNVTGTVTADGGTFDGTVLMNSSNELQFFNSNYGIKASTGLEIKTGDFTRFLQGTTEHMRIASGGNVGIGESDPDSTLTVKGASHTNFQVKSNSESTKAFIQTVQDSDVRIGSSTNHPVSFYQNGTARMSITSAGASIAGNLIVDAGVNGTIDFGNVTSAYGRLYADSTGTYVGSYTNNPLVLRTNNAERMRIDSSGNVGIGTSAPAVKLEVTGGNLGSALNDSVIHARIRGSRHKLDFEEIRTVASSDWLNTTYKLQMLVDSTKHQSIDFVSDSSAEEHIDIRTGNQLFNTRFDADGSVGIGTTSPSSLLHLKSNAPYITFEDDDNNQDWQIQATAWFAIRDQTAGQERMRIDGSGNVQIGTAAVTGGRYLDIYNTGSTSTDFAITRFITQQVGSSSTTSADIYKRKNGEFGFANNDTNSAAYINFKVGTSERMRITSAGNLLVGQTSATISSVGAYILNDGRVGISAASTIPLIVNRKTSDGDVIEVRKDQAVVGSIGTAGGDLTVNAASLGVLQVGGASKYGWNGSFIYPTNDNARDLGTSSFRFKDLYLSNSVSLSNATTSSFLQVSSNVLQFGTSSSDPVVFFSANVECMRIEATGVAKFSKAIVENKTTISGTSVSIDTTTGNMFAHTLSGNTTYTFTNSSAAGTTTSFTLRIIQDSTARTITWPSSVDWAGGTAPTLSTGSGDVDVFVFFTHDGGTTYYGFTAGQDMS